MSILFNALSNLSNITNSINTVNNIESAKNGYNLVFNNNEKNNNLSNTKFKCIRKYENKIATRSFVIIILPILILFIILFFNIQNGYIIIFLFLWIGIGIFYLTFLSKISLPIYKAKILNSNNLNSETCE